MCDVNVRTFIPYYSLLSAGTTHPVGSNIDGLGSGDDLTTSSTSSSDDGSSDSSLRQRPRKPIEKVD